MAEKKVIAYVDGYNLYEHCQAALRQPKGDPYTECYEELLRIMWYDPREIVRYCGEFDDLKPSDIETYFYTSRPWSGGKYNPGHYDRYIKALREIYVEVITGEFQPKTRKLDDGSIKSIINELGNILKNPSKNKIALKEFESFLDDTLEIPYQNEKQTDVNLAINMVTEIDAHTVVLVSMDSDFDPVIKKIIERKSNMNILILLPPVPKYEIEDRKLRKKKIYKKAKAAAKGVKFFLNEENFKVTNIEIEDIKECSLSKEVERKIKISDFKDKERWKHCQCHKNECVKKETSIIQP